MRYLPYVGLGGAVAAGAFLLLFPTWDRPPLISTDYGPAASELVVLTNPRRPPPYGTVPEPLPVAAEGGPLARDVYKNVQVLGDVPQAEFDRLMIAVTQWVAPKQGCGFCHTGPGADGKVNYADDALYTDKVARRMIQMTMKINTDWGNHVAPSGVVCFTCHRGENVPPRVWYRQPDPEHAGILGKPRPWQTNAQTIRNFFPTVPNQQWLVDDSDANLESNAALPGERGSGVGAEQDTENLYIMMMQWSDSLGANCGLCHNSRAFYDWKQSSPYRLDGLWGQYMTQDINKSFLIPAATLFPRDQLGQTGDSAKADCGTCHIGRQKPLGGYNLISHYPALAPKGVAAGPDQAVRDIMQPADRNGPAYDPTAKVIQVAVPAYPAPQLASGGDAAPVEGAPIGPAVLARAQPLTGVAYPVAPAQPAEAGGSVAPAPGAKP